MTISGNGSGNHAFLFPRRLALVPQGNIHIAASGSKTIKVFTNEGVYVRMYGNLTSPCGIAIDDEGYSIVAHRDEGDGEGDGNSLSIYDPQENKVPTLWGS